MTAGQLVALSPLIALAAGAVAVMSAIAIRRSHATAFAITVLACTISLAALVPAAAGAPRQVTPLFVIDGYALFFVGLVAAATLVTALLSYRYVAAVDVRHEEYYLLLLLASTGAAALAASDHLASLFLALETVSVALFALIAYRRDGTRPIEAGLKYLVLAGLSTGLLAFGLALLYAATGRLSFQEFGALAAAGVDLGHPVLLGGLVLTVAGIGFKLSLVPFHLWAPDVYQGAPAPVTGYLATVSKAAVFAVLLRYVEVAGVNQQAALAAVLTIIAIASMLAGNLLALLQNNLKRLLAYSSIAHLGYVLVPLIAGGAFGVEAAAFYFAAYAITNLGAFGVIAVLASGTREPERLEDYAGLIWQRPWLAGVLVLMLLSLAGIPLTAGFVAKFYALAAGIEGFLWWPVLALVLGSAIGLYYYLRVVTVMIRKPAAGVPAAAGTLGAATLACLAVALILLGVYPTPLIDWLAGITGG